MKSKQSGEGALPDGVAVRVESVGKVYRLFNRPQDRLKQVVFRHRKKLYRDFQALDDVSFEVGRGQVLGIVGRNGSGKSTLLQILAGVLQPTTGSVRVGGRVAALLELGSGFDFEYTGRQNVFMNGAILGIPREEMERRFDEIAAFADIGQFMDQPVKAYSSGMFVRLAFAVQACVRPEVLIVDEALSVGDVSFQRKCYRRLDELRDRGTTVLFVTHDLNAVASFCTQAILLEGGRVLREGAPIEIVEHYQKLLFGADAAASVQEYGDGTAHFEDVWIESETGGRPAAMRCDEPFVFCYRVRFKEAVDSPVLGMRMRTVQGVVLCATNTDLMRTETGTAREGGTLTIRWHCGAMLLPGTYFLSCGVSYPDADLFMCRRPDALKVQVTGATGLAGVCQLVRAASIEGSTAPGAMVGGGGR